MAGIPFATDLRALTWTVTTGMVLAGYEPAYLSDRDPEHGLWIDGTTVALEADQGAALPLAGLALIHHTFREGTRLQFRMHTAPAWGGATDVEVVTIVGPWQGLFAPHVYFDVAGRYPAEADRTKRYVRLDTIDANDVDVQIGELVPVVEVQALQRGVLYPAGLRAPVTFGRLRLPTKTGSVWTHDPRTRDRRWAGGLVLGADTADLATFAAWQHASRGIHNFLVWPEDGLTGEPAYAEFVDPAYEPAHTDPRWTDTAFAVQEVNNGEAY